MLGRRLAALFDLCLRPIQDHQRFDGDHVFENAYTESLPSAAPLSF